METLIYWLLVIGYYLLGLVAGLIVVALFYPALRTFPMTLMFVWGGALKRSAVLNLIWAMIFPFVLLGIGYFLLNLLTPAYEVIKSRSFLVGFLGTFLITLFNGGFRRSNLSLDYADFMKRHSNLPDGASDLHMLIATQVIQVSLSHYDDPKNKEKWDLLYELMKQLEFNDRDEELLVQTMVSLKAKDDEIALARDVYASEREYIESRRQAELDRIERERENTEFEESQKIEEEEFQRQMREWQEEHGLSDEDEKN